jgi:predicted HAD superfamily Cof-like phosphohydrolase
MKEEVEEYLQEIQKNSLADVAKELADILYTVYGTILEHGLQDKMPDVFEEVHRSNMSKDYAEYKMVKGKDYFKADIKKFFS